VLHRRAGRPGFGRSFCHIADDLGDLQRADDLVPLSTMPQPARVQKILQSNRLLHRSISKSLKFKEFFVSAQWLLCIRWR
jgi:hypothetical protein